MSGRRGKSPVSRDGSVQLGDASEEEAGRQRGVPLTHVGAGWGGGPPPGREHHSAGAASRARGAAAAGPLGEPGGPALARRPRPLLGRLLRRGFSCAAQEAGLVPPRTIARCWGSAPGEAGARPRGREASAPPGARGERPAPAGASDQLRAERVIVGRD